MANGWLNTLANENRAVISPQVLNEFAHNIIRKFPQVSHDELRANSEALRPWCVAPITDETPLQALAIHRRFRFSFYDCALLATAVTFGCEVFLSEDLSHDQRLGPLRIINPFSVAPSAFFKETPPSWASNAASSACQMSASRRSSMR
ncbi:MAG: PIN domain-containing protein [Steroidobacteraceae bacterium]